jgi:hypothetical protein
MKLPVKILAIVAMLALSAVPAIASADKPNENGNGPQYETAPEKPTPGPAAGLPAKAKAYGRYCKGESKKHVKGKKGTPFSQCVTAMAKLANDSTTTPAEACAQLSKKHVEGAQGTPYSQCVKGGATLRA